ncbi:MAG TPA: hypothetical protein VKX16_08985 [Chloroflexota bacterium]|nr:hypothetical protein [Chloroflexota bacterium]
MKAGHTPAPGEDRRVDLALAAGGYLRSLDGRVRQIPGLDRIAEETLRQGARVRWGTPARGRAGCTYLWRREIVLAAWLFDHPGDSIRDVWLHELGHCAAGRDCERARAWQRDWEGE